jgi:hypothetical protein
MTLKMRQRQPLASEMSRAVWTTPRLSEGGIQMTNTTKSKFKVTSSRTTAPIHTIITTEDGAYASVSTDGSIHIRWASGDRTDVRPKAISVTAAEGVEKMLYVFAEMVPTVHMVPDFTDGDEYVSWMKSIGLECTTHSVQ